MATPVPWPAVLGYAVGDPWSEQLDRGGSTGAGLRTVIFFVPVFVSVQLKNIIPVQFRFSLHEK